MLTRHRLEYAYAFGSGHIEFGPRVPNGALPICVLNEERRTRDGRLIHRAITRADIEGRARLAYDGQTYLVPGVPEAEDENVAYEAFARWVEWVRRPTKVAA